jgi:hypothetical protein
MYSKGTKGVFLALLVLAGFSVRAKELKACDQAKGLSRPMVFVENKGQVKDEHGVVRSDIRYKLSSPGLSLYLGSDELRYQFRQQGTTEGGSAKLTTLQVGVHLVGANAHAREVSLEPNSFYETYCTGNGAYTAHSSTRVMYQDVYPGIDWVVYTHEGKVEYDFVVRPGGDASQIKVRYEGATVAALADGGIEAHTAMGNIVEHAPMAYETESGKHVAAGFRVHDNVVSFATGSYKGSLTIDPYLSWSTYFGGTSDEVVTSVISYGGTGLLYAAGYTSSTSGIASGVGLPFNTFGGVYDAFVAAYSAAGVMSWATYFGGTADDRGTGIAADAGGNLYGYWHDRHVSAHLYCR